MRWPTPYGPPLQPVFTSQTLTLCRAILSPSRLAYTVGVLHEGCAKAGAEGGLGLSDPFLGSRDFGSVPGEKVVHRLRGREPRDQWQHAEGVGGQHDTGRRVAARPSRVAFGMWLIG